jgi:hypothetical protein
MQLNCTGKPIRQAENCHRLNKEFTALIEPRTRHANPIPIPSTALLAKLIKI